MISFTPNRYASKATDIVDRAFLQEHVYVAEFLLLPIAIPPSGLPLVCQFFLEPLPEDENAMCRRGGSTLQAVSSDGSGLRDGEADEGHE